MTNGDKGGGGVKNRDFYGDILFEWPLNDDYAVLFKNTRNLSMITHLGQQMGNVKFLKQAYQAATIDPFSHLFIDMRSDTPEIIRYRSNVLDEIQTVYQPV